MQVVHTKLIKVVHTEYSALKSSSKTIQEQAAAAVTVALISEKQQEKEKKRRVSVKHCLNPLSANPTKWSNTLKQFVGKLATNCLSMFDHFVGLALKGLKEEKTLKEKLCLQKCC